MGGRGYFGERMVCVIICHPAVGLGTRASEVGIARYSSIEQIYMLCTYHVYTRIF